MPPEPKVNVLLVDDHPENLLALEAILDSLGENLVKAHSGAEALRCLLNQDSAVILLDVQMPGMDGFETATLIRQRERSRHTPIIFLTAFSTSDTLVFKGYSLGAVDYLLKPIEPEILTSKVTVFIDLFKKTAEVKRQAAQLAAVNAELKESEQRFRSLSASSPVGIFLTDIEGNCTYTNPRCQVIWGSTFEEKSTERWLESVHPEESDRVLADWSTWIHEDREYSNEFRILVQTHPNTPVQEVVRWVHVRSSPMRSAQGQLIGHVGTVEDITERKTSEEARAQVIREQVARQEAEVANRMKDEFLATLSHELRTPLNSILGWARLLRTRKFDQQKTAQALETIERNATLQAQLIEDILDVSRIIRGKIRLVFRPVNAVSMIETALDTVRPAAEAKGIQLKTVINAPSGGDDNVSSLLVSGDPDRLQQIVWNLLSNAIKFTPAGGKVEVRLERTDSHVQIQVSDTGIGITTDFLPYIFERFRQADSTITRSYSGLGLGLAIVRQLVELHAGTIHADSAGEGKGATFTLKLLLTSNILADNASQVPRVESNLTLDTSSALDGLRILVVDDEPDICELLSVVFAECGAKVTAVASAETAIKTLQQLQPDVLISDIGMPEEDGYTLLRKVRNLDIKQGGQIPAVALTAYASQEDCTQALSAGFQMHISKPVDTTALIKAVAKLAKHTQKV